MAIEDSSLVRIAVALEELVKLGKQKQQQEWLADTCKECEGLVRDGWIPAMFFDWTKYRYESPARRSCNSCFKTYVMRQA